MRKVHLGDAIPAVVEEEEIVFRVPFPVFGADYGFAHAAVLGVVGVADFHVSLADGGEAVLGVPGAGVCAIGEQVAVQIVSRLSRRWEFGDGRWVADLFPFLLSFIPLYCRVLIECVALVARFHGRDARAPLRGFATVAYRVVSVAPLGLVVELGLGDFAAFVVVPLPRVGGQLR